MSNAHLIIVTTNRCGMTKQRNSFQGVCLMFSCVSTNFSICAVGQGWSMNRHKSSCTKWQLLASVAMLFEYSQMISLYWKMPSKSLRFTNLKLWTSVSPAICLLCVAVWPCTLQSRIDNHDTQSYVRLREDLGHIIIKTFTVFLQLLLKDFPPLCYFLKCLLLKPTKWDESCNPKESSKSLFMGVACMERSTTTIAARAKEIATVCALR